MRLQEKKSKCINNSLDVGGKHGNEQNIYSFGYNHKRPLAVSIKEDSVFSAIEGSAVTLLAFGSGSPGEVIGELPGCVEGVSCSELGDIAEPALKFGGVYVVFAISTMLAFWNIQAFLMPAIILLIVFHPVYLWHWISQFRIHVCWMSSRI